MIPKDLPELRQKLETSGLAVTSDVYDNISRESLVYGIVTRLHYVPIDVLRFVFRTVHIAQQERPDAAGWAILQKGNNGDDARSAR